MALLKLAARPAPHIPGVLADRRQAGPALLRMLSRARRGGQPLLLARLVWPEAAAEAARRLLLAVAGELRLADLAWWEAAPPSLWLLLEGGGPAVLERIERRAQAEGLAVTVRAARFPQQGLTLAALMEQVQ